MKITVQELLGALTSFSKYLSNDPSDDEESIPAKSLVVSTIYLLKKFNNEKSSLPGVTNSISQWAFDSSEYNTALNQYNTYLSKKLKTEVFSPTNESSLSNILKNLQNAQTNGTKYTRTDMSEYNLIITYIAEFTFMVFLLLALSIQINTGSLSYMSSTESKIMCSLISKALNNLKDNTNKLVDNTNTWVYWAYSRRDFTSSREFKSLLVYTKSIRHI